MSSTTSWAARLYRGDVSYDFVGNQKRWYAISAVILLISLGALLVKGITPGIEFKGGAEFTVSSSSASVSGVRSVVQDVLGTTEPIIQEVGGKVRLQTPALTAGETDKLEQGLSSRFGVSIDDLSARSVGPSWGAEITRKAVTGLVVFLVLVVLFLSIVFEWRMAVAAMVALLHDLAITVGIYALVGFEVTPATVIGFLTILGYSLYDTVVVFDKVRENTRGLTGGNRYTYSEAANLAVNQTLVRSVNTSLVALMPVAAILAVGAGLLGAGTLKDLALALFIGIAVGTYSSIFVATPLLADLKERDPAMVALRRRVLSRRGGAASGASASSRADGRPRAGASDEATQPTDDDSVQLDDAVEVSAAPRSGATSAPAAGRPGAPRRTATNRPKGGSSRRPNGKRRS